MPRATVRARAPAALALAAIGAAQAATQAPPEVRLGDTQIRGLAGLRHPAVAVFRGIPFAQAPVGERRWRAPEAVVLPAGPREATRFAAACFQDGYTTDWYRKVGAAFGVDAGAFREPAVDEDCLYLNVWTPSPVPGASLPVMVWIHGGANWAGWSFEPNYDGEALAARGVVVVSLAYRVGVFGFFGHPQLEGSANAGLLDQVIALRWIRDHVGQFGGDAGNVTLFGESAGAANIGYLMLSPAARGLFRRAISQSGGYHLLERRTRAGVEARGLALAAALPGRPGLAALRDLGSRAILDAARTGFGTDDFGPAVDGEAVPAAPGATVLAQPVAVELLVGTNEDEWRMYVEGSEASLAAAIDAFPEPVRPALRSLAAAEPDLDRAEDRVVTFANMVCPGYLMARAATRAGVRAYVYRFTRVRPGAGGERLGAYHGAEIPYVFDTHDPWLPGEAADRRLTDALMQYWTRFARTGDPNGEGLPHWPGYDAAEPRVMALGDGIVAQPAPDHATCLAQAEALYGARP